MSQASANDEPNSVARVSKYVVFNCGCQAEFPLVGTFSGLGWHIIPCTPCARARASGVLLEGELEAMAQQAWDKEVARSESKEDLATQDFA